MCIAAPMKVIEVDGDAALVDRAGARLRVSLAVCDQPAVVGDYVIVHAGFAIHRLDPDSARETLELFDQLAALSLPEPTINEPADD